MLKRVRIRLAITASFLFGSILLDSAAAANPNDPAISEPIVGIGVNYYDVLIRRQYSGRDPQMADKLKRLAQSGIPFIRFAATPFWPDDMKSLLADPQKWLAAMDDVIATAQVSGLLVVPCIFWNYRTIPDVVGEPIASWGDANSKTIALMRELTKLIVSRYANSPTILAWEFSNEMNSYADLPNSYTYMLLNPKRGTPVRRSGRDQIRSNDMIFAYLEFAKAVRASGAAQMLSTGSDAPRAEATNLTHGSFAKDSRTEFVTATAHETPPQYALASLHLYPNRVGQHPWAVETGISGMVSSLVQATRDAGRIPFLAEFGVPASGDVDQDAANLQSYVDAITENCVGISALWVFDFPLQAATYNVTFDNARGYQLALIAKANHTLQERCGGRRTSSR